MARSDTHRPYARLLDRAQLVYAAKQEGVPAAGLLANPFLIGWLHKRGGATICWQQRVSVEAAMQWMMRHDCREFFCQGALFRLMHAGARFSSGGCAAKAADDDRAKPTADRTTKPD